MREGRWFGYSVRAIYRATAVASEAALRRWGTTLDAAGTTTLTGLVTEREAIVFARAFAQTAGVPLHAGNIRALGDGLVRLTPLPADHCWVTITGTTPRLHTTLADLTAALDRAREPVTVIPVPAAPQ